MEERIINLLTLCMRAQENGNNVEFTNAIDRISIWDYTDGKYIHFCIYDDGTMDAAEAYLKELISA